MRRRTSDFLLLLLLFAAAVPLRADPLRGRAVEPLRAGAPASRAVEPLRAGVPGSRAFDPTGSWAGVLIGPGNTLPLVLRVRADPAGVWQGMLDIPARGLFDARGSLGVSGDSVRLEVRALGASFRGVRAGADTVAGTWTQAGFSLPLQLVRQSVDPVRRRPQDPRGVLPYRELQVAFGSAADGVLLHGTLTLPAGAGPHPAVLLIGGSGPQDRDASFAGHRPFLVLADHLARRGLAVLRYDERGVGASTGDFQAATTLDHAADAHAAIEFLARHPAVEGASVGVIGHSEGGMIAPLVAGSSPAVEFLVLLAAPGLPLRDIAVRQAETMTRAEGMSDAWVASHVAMVDAIFDLYAQDLATAELGRRIRVILERAHADSPFPPPARAALIEQALAAYLSPWAQFAFRYHPAPALRRVRVPVLALNGSLDTQVDGAANLDAIAAALSAGGNDRVVTALLPGLNHYFQTAATGALSEYALIAETFAPLALRRIDDWIGTLLRSLDMESP
jgi:uncharacterized protein